MNDLCHLKPVYKPNEYDSDNFQLKVIESWMVVDWLMFGTSANEQLFMMKNDRMTSSICTRAKSSANQRPNYRWFKIL